MADEKKGPWKKGYRTNEQKNVLFKSKSTFAYRPLICRNQALGEVAKTLEYKEPYFRHSISQDDIFYFTWCIKCEGINGTQHWLLPKCECSWQRVYSTKLPSKFKFYVSVPTFFDNFNMLGMQWISTVRICCLFEGYFFLFVNLKVRVGKMMPHF